MGFLNQYLANPSVSTEKIMAIIETAKSINGNLKRMNDSTIIKNICNDKINNILIFQKLPAEHKDEEISWAALCFRIETAMTRDWILNIWQHIPTHLHHKLLTKMIEQNVCQYSNYIDKEAWTEELYQKAIIKPGFPHWLTNIYPKLENYRTFIRHHPDQWKNFLHSSIPDEEKKTIFQENFRKDFKFAHYGTEDSWCPADIQWMTTEQQEELLTKEIISTLSKNFIKKCSNQIRSIINKKIKDQPINKFNLTHLMQKIINHISPYFGQATIKDNQIIFKNLTIIIYHKTNCLQELNSININLCFSSMKLCRYIDLFKNDNIENIPSDILKQSLNVKNEIPNHIKLIQQQIQQQIKDSELKIKELEKLENNLMMIQPGS
jgi:hypothetical protein